MARDQDIFTHHFKLNFNRRGDTHPTPIGGIISLLLKIMYISYMVYLFNKMWTYDDDRTYKFDYTISEEELAQNVSIKDMGVYQF